MMPKKKIWRRLLIALLVLPIALALAAGGLFMWIRTESGRSTVRDLALRFTKEIIPGLKVGRIGGDYTHQLVLEDVAILDEQGRTAISAERIDLEYSLWPLLHKQVAIRKLSLVKPEVHAKVMKDGTLNLAHLFHLSDEPPSKGPIPWRVELDRAEIVKAEALLEDGKGARTAVWLTLEAQGRWKEGAAAVKVSRLDVELATGVPGDTSYRRIAAHRAGRGPLEAKLEGDHITVKGLELAVRGILPVDAPSAASNPIELDLSAEGTVAEMLIDLGVKLPSAGRLHLQGKAGLAKAGSGDPAGAQAERQSIPHYDLKLAVEKVDPHVVVLALAPGRIGGKVALTGRGVPFERGSRLDLHLDLAQSLVEGIRLEVVRVVGGLQGKSWRLQQAQISAPGLGLKAAGKGTLDELALDIDATLDAVEGRSLPVSRLLPEGLEGLGRIDVHAEGPIDLSRLTVKGKAEVSKLVMGKTKVDAARLDLDAKYLPDRPVIKVDGQIDRLQTGELAVSTSHVAADVALIKGVPSGRVVIQSQKISGKQGMLLDEVSADARGDGKTLALTANAKGRAGSGGVALHGTLHSAARTGLGASIVLDRAEVATKQERVVTKRAADIEFRQNELVSIKGLQVDITSPQFSGEVAVDGSYRLGRIPRTQKKRRDESPHVAEVKVGIKGGRYAELSAIDLGLAATLDRTAAELLVEGTIGKRRVPLRISGHVPMRMDRQGTPHLAESGALRLAIDATDVHLEELPLPIRLSRHGVRQATFDLKAEAGGDIALPRGKLTLAVKDARIRDLPPGAAHLQLDTGVGGTELTTKVSLGQRTVLDLGTLTKLRPVDVIKWFREKRGPFPNAPLSGKISVGPLELGLLEKLDRQFARIGGTLSGEARISGTTVKPRGELEMKIADAKVDKTAFGEVVLTGKGDGLGQEIHVEMAQVNAKGAPSGAKAGQGEAGRLIADVRHNSRLDAAGKLDGSLKAKRFDLGFARVFVPSLREIGGKLDGGVQIGGTLAKPLPAGKLTLSDGRLGVIGQPTLGGLESVIAIAPTRVTVEKLQAASGSGTLSATGAVDLDGFRPRTVAVDANARDFMLAWGGISGAKLDGKFIVRGALKPDIVKGEVQVPSASLWIPKFESGKNLHRTGARSDVIFVDGVGGAPDPEEAPVEKPLKMQVTGRIGTFYIRGKDMDLEVEGNLQVNPARDGRPALSGQVSVRRGHIMLENRRYRVERAVLSWNGDPDNVEPQLDLLLTHSFSDAQVSIALRGTPSKPKLDLSSEPALDPAQIASLIVTGRASGAPSSGNFDPTAMVGTLVLGKIADKIAPQVGIDVVRLERRQEQEKDNPLSSDTDTRVEVGKYLSEDIYFSYVHIFGSNPNQNTNEANVEYRLTRRWVLETAFGDAGQGGVDMLWTYRY